MESESPSLPVAGSGSPPIEVLVPPGTVLLDCTVYGVPVQQGSKTRLRWSTVDDNAERLRPWREAIVAVALAEKFHVEPWPGPCAVLATYWFTRPRSHFRTGRFADLLKDSAPLFHTTYPDADKLLRSTLDALTTARVYADDSRVAWALSTKKWQTPAEPPGADLVVVGIA